MPSKHIESYEIIARPHRAIPSSSEASEAGSSNLFDIFLYAGSQGNLERLAEMSFQNGSPDSWPQDKYTTALGDKYLIVHAPMEAFAGVVDLLRNETNRYFQWADPVEGRARAVIRSAIEPTGEGEQAP